MEPVFFIWWTLSLLMCTRSFYWFIIFIALPATFLRFSYRDLIKTGSADFPEQSNVKVHPSHQSYIKKSVVTLTVHCTLHTRPPVLTMVWAVRGIKSGVLFDSNLWGKRIALLHLVPSFAHAITNQNDLKWSTNLCTSLIGKESSRSGLGAWCGFSLATRTPDTLLRGYPGHFPHAE